VSASQAAHGEVELTGLHRGEPPRGACGPARGPASKAGAAATAATHTGIIRTATPPPAAATHTGIIRTATAATTAADIGWHPAVPLSEYVGINACSQYI